MNLPRTSMIVKCSPILLGLLELQEAAFYVCQGQEEQGGLRVDGSLKPQAGLGQV